jgi:hypothetical protein
MQAQHSGLEEVADTQKSLRDLCARYELAMPGPKPAPSISPETIGRAINQAMELLVPGNDLLQIALGNKKMPDTPEARIELFISTALDFMPGGKLMRLFKSAAARKVQGHILKLASKSKMVEKVIHFGKMKVPTKIFHDQIKPNILNNSGKFAKVVGENPDVKIVGKKIILTARGSFKGKNFDTGLDVADFF